MPRGYRFVIIAAFGWLSLAFSPAPKHSSQAEQAKANNGATQSVPTATPTAPIAVEIVERPKKPEPCGPNGYGSNDDLCAQWKAADAAREAANYSFWGLLAAVIGTIGLGYNLWLTRAAVEVARDATKDADSALAIAERNADAAQRTVEETARIGEAQVKCYLGVVGVTLSYSKITDKIHVNCKVKNSGQSPARKISWEHEMLYYNSTTETTRYGEKEAPKILKRRDLMSGQEEFLDPAIVGFVLNADELNAVANSGHVYAEVRITLHAKDVFGGDVVEFDRFCGVLRTPITAVAVELDRTGHSEIVS